MRRSALLMLLLLLASPPLFAMRCGNRVIAEGAQDFQVRERCGEPFWTDRYSRVEVVGAHGPLERQRSVQFDVWYYNFGPRQLMRRLLLRDGVLVREDTLGYGVNAIGADCAANATFSDLSAGELVARCGEPSSRRSHDDTLVRRPARGIEEWFDQRREDWVYDDGDGDYVRIVHLLDGRVGNVERVRR